MGNMHEERVDFYAESVEPIRLEGLLDLPEEDGPYQAAILCHPHPVGGGSMHVPLLEVIAGKLADSGRACLRFNFRGVGRSTGTPSGGIQETEDVEGALRWLRERDDIFIEDLAVAGWSFGSWVGLRWAVNSEVCRKVALVSPPLVGFDFFQFLDSEDIFLPEESLIICGERDQFSDQERLKELARRLGSELRILSGADHFLFGREKEIAEIISSHWS
jgi:alpha/beta superfamily hydrolase